MMRNDLAGVASRAVPLVTKAVRDAARQADHPTRHARPLVATYASPFLNRLPLLQRSPDENGCTGNCRIIANSS